MTSDGIDPPAESVMEGHGYYAAHSAPQHAAAAPGFPMLERAAAAAPLPGHGPLVIADLGCAGGRNELEPLGRAIDAVRARRGDLPVVVVHADLPSNDWATLFDLVERSPGSYLTGRPEVYAVAAGRSLFGPVWPDATLTLVWTAITVHWLSSMPDVATGSAVFSNLTTGAVRDALAQRSADDWRDFLRERAREVVPGGQVVVVAGASDPAGTSGAEGLFTMVGAELDEMVAAGTLRAVEQERIFYPTWNRTPDELLDPVRSGPAAAWFELEEWEPDAIDDADTHPQ